MQEALGCSVRSSDAAFRSSVAAFRSWVSMRILDRTLIPKTHRWYLGYSLNMQLIRSTE